MTETKTLLYKQAISLERYEEIEYMLAWLPNNSLTPFVCGWLPTYDENGTLISWGQGHYFSCLKDAIEYIEDRIANQKKEVV